MPTKYSSFVRKFVLDMLHKKKKTAEAIEEFTGVSKRSVIRWDTHGISDRTPVFRGTTKLKEAWKGIQILLEQKPNWTYKTLQSSLYDMNIKCGLRTIFQVLKNNNISRKRIKKTKCSKNATPEKLSAFKDVWNQIKSDGKDTIFQDESHFSNNLLPLYGYSLKNVPCYIHEPSERSAHTLNFAFSTSGQLFWKVYSGSITTSRLQWFVDALPPTRVLMDNHSVHKAVRMEVDKVFTPVAQPYANPVEIIFSKIKTMFRSINADNRSMSVEDKIEKAIQTLTSDDLENAVKHVDKFVNANYNNDVLKQLKKLHKQSITEKKHSTTKK